MKKEKNSLGLILICLAPLFLFNPSLTVLDVLPDVFGYFLLCVGLIKLSDMNHHFEESLNYFKKMLLVSVFQLVSFFVFFKFMTTKERPVATLLFTFVFAIFEIIFLTNAYRKFFEGFLYMGSRMNGVSVFNTQAHVDRWERKQEKAQAKWERENEKRRRKNLPPRPAPRIRPLKNATSKIQTLTLVFIFAKAILSVLPEFSSLTDRATSGSTRFVFLYDYIGLYRTVALTILTPICVIWLVKILAYLISVMKDAPFMEALTQKYREEILPKTHLFILRTVKLAFAVLVLGLFFSIDFYIENNSIFPDFVCPLLIVSALLLLKKFIKIPIVSYLSCALYAVGSLVTYLLSMRFYENYSLSLTDIRIEAHNAFFALEISKTVDSLFFLLMILSLFPILKQIIDLHTGFAPENASSAKADFVHQSLRSKVLRFMILAAVCAAGSVAYIWFLKEANFIWIIDFVLHFIFCIYGFSVLSGISDEMEQKYLLS